MGDLKARRREIGVVAAMKSISCAVTPVPKAGRRIEVGSPWVRDGWTRAAPGLAPVEARVRTDGHDGWRVDDRERADAGAGQKVAVGHHQFDLVGAGAHGQIEVGV